MNEKPHLIHPSDLSVMLKSLATIDETKKNSAYRKHHESIMLHCASIAAQITPEIEELSTQISFLTKRREYLMSLYNDIYTKYSESSKEWEQYNYSSTETSQKAE
ncbi:hypothetical protein [Brevibacillus centrosporus]|uniref:Uncharacterized protein n=1 Tax=Brevibacillus centrosporus TaxID=54910 RepID=A0A1I3M2F0_9BACL|nr:hypothetical protein [Brevibacillus centrosporus]SFI91172.1 hypothetical protein SAMN05518846_101499 [Brevibacillus centrosporus]